MDKEKINARTASALKSIEDAVFSLLEKKEFDKLTCKDIYVAAKVNKMTFYKYHKNKYDALAKAFVSRLNQEYDAAFPDVARLYRERGLDEANCQGLLFVIDFIDRYHIQFSHLLSSKGDFPLEVVFSAFYANFRPFFWTIVNADINGENEYFARYAFAVYRAIYDSWMREYSLDPEKRYLQKDAEKACRVFAKMISTLILSVIGGQDRFDAYLNSLVS